MTRPKATPEERFKILEDLAGWYLCKAAAAELAGDVRLASKIRAQAWEVAKRAAQVQREQHEET